MEVRRTVCMGGFSTERKSGTGWSREANPSGRRGALLRRSVGGELRGRDLRVTLGWHAGRRQVRWGASGNPPATISAVAEQAIPQQVADRRKLRGDRARRKLPPPRGRVPARTRYDPAVERPERLAVRPSTAPGAAPLREARGAGEISSDASLLGNVGPAFGRPTMASRRRAYHGSEPRL